MSDPNDQLVLTPDGRQISQKQYYIEQELSRRQGQFDKLQSLASSPIAAGVYGAMDTAGADPQTRDTATGVTAAIEGGVYGTGGFPRHHPAINNAQTNSKALDRPGGVTRMIHEDQSIPDIHPELKPLEHLRDNQTGEIIWPSGQRHTAKIQKSIKTNKPADVVEHPTATTNTKKSASELADLSDLGNIYDQSTPLGYIHDAQMQQLDRQSKDRRSKTFVLEPPEWRAIEMVDSGKWAKPAPPVANFNEMKKKLRPPKDE